MDDEHRYALMVYDGPNEMLIRQMVVSGDPANKEKHDIEACERLAKELWNHAAVLRQRMAAPVVS